MVGAAVGRGGSVGAPVGRGVSVDAAVGRGVSVGAAVGRGVSVGAAVGRGGSVGAAVGKTVGAVCPLPVHIDIDGFINIIKYRRNIYDYWFLNLNIHTNRFFLIK